MKVFLRTCGRSVLRRAGDERGIALVTAVIVSAGLISIAGSIIYFTTQASHTSSRQNADAQAYALAEAGINTAIAKIYGAEDPRTAPLHAGTTQDPATVVPDCSSGVNADETPDCYSTGSVTYSGTLDKTDTGNTWYWNISSTGAVSVPGVSTVKRTLTRSVGVTGNNGTNGNSWTRFYQNDDSPSSCLTLDGVTVPTNFSSRGCITLENGAQVTGSTTNMQAGTTIYVDPPETNNPTSYSTSGSGASWTSGNYAETSDSRYASASISNGQTTYNLSLTNFGWNLPSTATISGISVAIVEKASSNSSTTYVVDNQVQLLKAGSTSGITNKANTSTKWGTSDTTQTYGSSTDLWGKTWTGSDIDASNFGVQIQAKGACSGSNCHVTAYVNAVTITVYYQASSIGSSGSPIGETDTGNGCQLNSNTAHSPCSSTDHVWATTNNTVSEADNTNLSMPTIDWTYWYNNAMPGPKQFCTNSNNGTSSKFFNNPTANGEVAPKNSAYDCEVWKNGVLQGELKWDGSHTLTVYGNIFFNGNFRFDEDGEIIHYFGRANIMSSEDDEIDALVCAGGTGTTYATSCLSNMSSWNPSQNMLVLMSECSTKAPPCNEYDQGGTHCSGSKPNCWDGYLPGGFQGILYSKGTCLIHQEFQDSGPVICEDIDVAHETYNPTFFSFPSIGNLTDGMSFSDTNTATDFTLNVSAQQG